MQIIDFIKLMYDELGPFAFWGFIVLILVAWLPGFFV